MELRCEGREWLWRGSVCVGEPSLLILFLVFWPFYWFWKVMGCGCIWIFLVFWPFYRFWKVMGWWVHLDYNVSSGPFLTINFECDYDNVPGPAWQLTLIFKVSVISCPLYKISINPNFAVNFSRFYRIMTIGGHIQYHAISICPSRGDFRRYKIISFLLIFDVIR